MKHPHVATLVRTYLDLSRLTPPLPGESRHGASPPCGPTPGSRRPARTAPPGPRGVPSRPPRTDWWRHDFRAQWLVCLVLLGGLRLWGGAEEVVVVYNTEAAPDSRLVAEHYAQRRGVPANQIIGLNLPRGETMSRPEFTERLQKPLVDALEQRSLLKFHGEIVPAREGQPGRVVRVPVAASVRYVALCYGVPVRILEDQKPTGTNKTLLPQQRREAAVDTELALAPGLDTGLPIEGIVPNRLRGTTQFHQLHPTNGLLMVTRLDGPSGSQSRNLVDSALAAEANGLWGRAYFDARGITNGGYKLGDDWILEATAVARRQGLETVFDGHTGTFSTGFPFSQVALYAGWYDQGPSGPFRQPTVEFVPGAVAYHIYSFSARSIRSTDTWVGCLLDKGAAATVGYVNEPYLDLTIDVGIWFARLLESGATFGEAAYAALPAFSWQTTLVGDPLYRPFHGLAAAGSDAPGGVPPAVAPWVRLREVNLSLARGDPPGRLAEALARAPDTQASAILEEKIGDLHELDRQLTDALAAYRRALALKPTPQQRLRLQLALPRLLTSLQRPAEAIEAYEQFFKQNPKYPDLLGVYRPALALARQMRDEALVRRYEAEIKYLSPAPAAPNNQPSAAPHTTTPTKPK